MNANRIFMTLSIKSIDYFFLRDVCAERMQKGCRKKPSANACRARGLPRKVGVLHTCPQQETRIT